MHAAWKIDTAGKREARQEIAMIKVQAANMVMSVLDRAIQLHGALGMSDDTPIARFWRENRSMRIVDGPDEVHRMHDSRGAKCAAKQQVIATLVGNKLDHRDGAENIGEGRWPRPNASAQRTQSREP